MSKTPIEKLPYRPNVGLMVLNRDGLVFTARRKDTPDAWQMPQGGVDKGETPGQAAIRELKEEIGTNNVEFLAVSREPHRYDLPPDLVGRMWGGKWRGQEQTWFLVRFLGDDAEIDIETEHPEFDAWRWSDTTELLECIVSFKRPVYEAILAEFAPLIKPAS